MPQKRPLSFIDKVLKQAAEDQRTDIAYTAMDDSDRSSITGGLKSLGKNFLNALSVPQATLYTLSQKAGHAIAPKEVRDTSWKNLAGGFRGSAYKGGAGWLEGFGVDSKTAKKWGGLGLDIFADPLNLVGIGLIAKGAKHGGKAANVIDDIFKSSKPVQQAARELLPKEVRTQLAKGMTTKAPAITLSEHKQQTYDKLLKAIKNKKRKRELEGVLSRHDYLEELNKKIDKLVKQKKKVKPTRKEAEQLERELRKEALSTVFPKYRGPKDVLPDEFVAVAPPKRPKYKKPSGKEQRGRAYAGQQPLAGTFAPGQIVDEVGNLKDTGKAFATLASAQKNRLVPDQPMEYALNIGIGKFKKQIGLGKTKKVRGFADLKRNPLALNTGQKFAHALTRSARDLGEGAKENMLRLGQSLGFSEADSALLTNIAYMQMEDVAGARNFVEELRAAGQWGNDHDKALEYMLKTGEDMGRAEGKVLNSDELLRKQGVEKKLRDQLAQATRPKTIAKLERQLEDLQDEMLPLLGKGRYMHQQVTDATQQQYRKARQDAIWRGEEVPSIDFNTRAMTTENPDIAKQFHPTRDVTEADYRERMLASGMSEELTDTLVDRVQKILGPFAKSTAQLDYGIMYRPEWDAFLIHGDRMRAHFGKLADREIEKMIKTEIPGDALQEAAKKMLRGYDAMRAPGAIGSTKLGSNLQKGIAYMKWAFTTVNPAHFTNNLLGDATNRMVNGYMRHLAIKAVPKTRIWKLSQAEQKMLGEEFDIGGRIYKGQEILALSRLVGLGRGYVGADIHDMIDVLRHGPGPVGFMGRLNLNRENAQRLDTWVRHMQAGEDPWSAGAKTLRVHFDYGELTDFERVWMRNLLLFYTWLKKNSMLHAGGMLTRPGIYQAYGDIERNRQAYENEPEYYGKQGAFTIPGLGNIFYANPLNDIYKWDLSQEGFRQNLMSAITPPARIPLEIYSNKNFFTGAPIEQYTDQNKPYWLAQLFGDTLVDGKPAMDAQLVHMLSSVLGPQAAIQQSRYTDDISRMEALLRFFGLPRPQQVNQEKFDEQAKARQTRQKADATRKRNKEEPR